MKQEELLRLCQRARLTLQPVECSVLAQEMDEILTFVQAVCATEAPAQIHCRPNEQTAHLREDVPAPCSGREEVLRNCEESHEGFFQLSGKR